MQRVSQNLGLRGVVLVIPKPGKKGSGSGLHPSEKELPEQRSDTFCHKNTPGYK
jgi:hypothetical protein